MRLVYPDFGFHIDTEYGVAEVIIENQVLLYNFLKDINLQIEGYDGDVVLSDKMSMLQISKRVELLKDFIPFEINKKSLLSKLLSKYKELAISELYYDRTIAMLNSIKTYMYDIAISLSGSVSLEKCSIDNIIKATGPRFDESYNTLSEELLDYFELVREYDDDKLFVLLNIRSLINDEELEQFIRTAEIYKYNIILIESSERMPVEGVKRYIIDDDLCTIQ